MSKSSVALFVAIVGFHAIILNEASENSWEYTIHSFNWSCTDVNVIAAPLRAVRIIPGVYGLNGTIRIGANIDEQYKVSVQVLRSTAGSSHYIMTPFRIPKNSFPVFMNTIYKKYAMDDLKTCSNIPVFEHFEDPLAIGDYHLNACVISTKEMPTHMHDGYYKVIFEVEGPLAHFVSELVAQIYQKS